MTNDIPLGQDAIPIDNLPLGADAVPLDSPLGSDAQPIDNYQNSVNAANTHLLADILKGGSKLLSGKLGAILGGPLAPQISPYAAKAGEQLLPNGKEIPSDVLIQNLVQQAPLLAVGGPEVGAPEFVATKISKLSPLSQYVAKYLGSIGTNAGLGAGLNAISGNSPTSGAAIGAGSAALVHPLTTLLATGNPYLKALGGLGLGGLIGSAASSLTGHPLVSSGTGGVLGTLLAMRKRGFSDLAIQNVLGKLTEEQKMNALARQAAGEKAGVPLTALEAIGTPVAGRQFSLAGATPEAGNLLYDYGLKRPGIEKSAINDLKSMISPENAKEKLENPLYTKTENDKIPATSFANLLSDPYFKGKIDKVFTAPKNFVELQGFDPNSYKALQKVKGEIDKDITKAQNLGHSDDESTFIGKKNELLNLMDQFNPDYRLARQIAEKRITRDSITKGMNDAEVSANNFYNKFLRNDDKYKELYNHLRDPNNPKITTPAQEKLQAMREAFSYLLPIKNAKSEAAPVNEGLKAKLNPADLAKSIINNAVMGHYNKALVNFITRPDWDAEFARLQQIKDKTERAKRMANLLSKVATTGAVSAYNMPTQQGS